MIVLDVKPYCHNCKIFSAAVEKPQYVYGPDGPVFMTDTVIRCEKRNTCAGLVRYLEKEMQKGEEE